MKILELTTRLRLSDVADQGLYRIWNYRTSGWQDLAFIRTYTSDTTISNVFENKDDYRNPADGKLKLRISVYNQSTGSVLEVWIDYIHLLSFEVLLQRLLVLKQTVYTSTQDQLMVVVLLYSVLCKV